MNNVDSFLEKQIPINQEIAKSMIGATPESWNEISLTVKYISSNEGYDELEYVFESPEGHKDIVSATTEVYESTAKLFNLYRDSGKQWKKIKCFAAIKGDGNWGFDCDFEY